MLNPRRTVLAMVSVVAASLFPIVRSCQGGQATPSGETLRDFARPNFYIGTAVSYEGFKHSSRYRATLQREYNMIIAENVGKMDVLEPSFGKFSFSRQDTLCAFARAHGMKMEAGPLVWAHAVPSWLTDGRFSADQLRNIMTNYITTVVKHYTSTCPGIVIAWEVVNEATTTGPGVWGSIPNYVRIAFEAARAADPHAILFYNDYGDEQDGNAVFSLVSPLKAQGLVDAVGFQCHLASAPNFSSIASNMRKFEAIGLQVFITEFDYRIRSSSGRTADDPTDLQLQASVYRNLLAICLAASNCSEFLTWGFSDAYSWIPWFFSGYGAALPFDAHYRPKPAYYGLQAAMSGLSLP
jgi:endo-1,4-beta-xylanase